LYGRGSGQRGDVEVSALPVWERCGQPRGRDPRHGGGDREAGKSKLLGYALQVFDSIIICSKKNCCEPFTRVFVHSF